MSNAFVFPFNYNPSDNKESSTSYTVPAGKYAIMSATLSVSAYGSFTGIDSNNVDENATSSSTSTTIQLYLKTGSVVTKTETPATTSVNAGSGGTGRVFASGTSFAQLLVDGTEVSTIECGAIASLTDIDAVAGISSTADVSGTATVDWHIAEYDAIT